MKYCYLILFSILCIGNADAQSKKEQKFIQQYIDAAFFKIDDDYQYKLMKWEGLDTIQFTIHGDLRFLTERDLEKFLGSLSDITGIEFWHSDDDYDSHISIYFSSLKDYFKKEGIKDMLPSDHNLSYWSQRRYTPEHSLLRTSFCIDASGVDGTNPGLYMFKHMFLEAMGLMGDCIYPESIYYSIYTGANHKFTRYDKRFAMLHYNENIRAGMRESEVWDVMDKIDLESIRKEKFK